MSGFRRHFGKLPKALNWYPKHMNSGLKQMQAKLRSVDCIIELHDARIPFTGRNPNFYDTFIRDKPHILVLNKADLITNDMCHKIRDLVHKAGTKNVLFTNCKDDQNSGLKKLTPMIIKLIEESDRYHRAFNPEYHAMIIGVPNVGKSSLINLVRSRNLKKGRALKIAPSAGVTKMVHHKVKICNDPPLFLFDTPGILTPRIDADETGMKLAVCGNLPDHDVGQVLIADYMLFAMNKNGYTKYIEFMGLDGPCDCILTVLTKGCLHHNLMMSVRVVDAGSDRQTKPNYDGMAKIFIDKFRKAEFGRIVLDDLTDDTVNKFTNVELYKNEVLVTS